jgi:signal transduction histidine kinase
MIAPRTAVFAIHDAKNMLGVVTANVEYLGAVLADSVTPPGVASALNDLRESSDRLAELLREALGALRGRPERPSAPSIVRVGTIVAAAVDRIRRRAQAMGVRVDVQSVDDPCASIEPDLFERVLDNLLDNALRFSKSGDVIEVTSTAWGSHAVVSVADQGPGVSEHQREAIFASYRERESTEGAHFGLGLAFCRAVARAHGGDVRVQNRRMGGACFVLEIS